jgi:hypothetical protein
MNLTLEIPESWRQLIPTPEDQPSADNVLRALQQDCAARDPDLAFALLLDGELGQLPLAVLEVKRYSPAPGSEAVTAADVLRQLCADDPQTVRLEHDPEVTLPAGPALRFRRLRAEEADPDRGTAPLVDSVVHAVLPPGTGEAVVLTMSWPSLVLSASFAELADEIAGTLRVGAPDQVRDSRTQPAEPGSAIGT